MVITWIFSEGNMVLNDGELVQWLDGEACKTGRILRFVNGDNPAITIAGLEYTLVRHSHCGTLEFVRYNRLKPYPSEPIPEPMK